MVQKQPQLYLQGENDMKIDINAPIIPFEGLGGIKLYSTKEELKDISMVVTHSDIVEDWFIKV